MSAARHPRPRCARTLAAALCALFCLLAAAPAAGAAACPRTSLPDVQDEVMCLVCGVPLENAGGPQAEDERSFIRELVDRCKSKAEIKAALVSEYGDGVLAAPSKHGFELSAYLVPVVAGLVAAIALAAGALRWRRARGVEEPLAQTAGVDDEMLDRDLEKYDL